MSVDMNSSLAAEHRSVSRVMGLIEAIVANEPEGLKLGELADALSAPKSSVHGLAKGLVALGYLQERDSKYFSGPAMAAIGQLLSSRSEERWRRSFTEQLRLLSETWNETAMLGELVGDSVVYLESVESTQTLRAAVPLHTRVQTWPASSGKCILAFMPPRRRDAYFDRIGLSGKERKDAMAELAEVKERRVAFNVGGTAVGMVGVASPVFLPGRPIPMTIAVTGPEVRLVDKLEELGHDVLQAATILSAE